MEKAMRLGFRPHPAAAWIDDLVAAWNAHDPVAVTDFMTNDVVYADFGLGEEYRGIDAVRDFVEGMELGFSSDYRFALEMAIVTDDAYAWEWTMTGTNDGADEEHGFPRPENASKSPVFRSASSATAKSEKTVTTGT
jgi:hypothetical protein